VQPLLNKFCPLADIIIPNKNDDFKGKFFIKIQKLQVLKRQHQRKAEKKFFHALVFPQWGGKKHGCENILCKYNDSTENIIFTNNIYMGASAEISPRASLGRNDVIYLFGQNDVIYLFGRNEVIFLLGRNDVI
jgi:hypothetical protein